MFELEPRRTPVTQAEREERGRQFIEALCLAERSTRRWRATKLANESLAASLDGSEELALAHSELLLNRRKETGALPRRPVGCGVGAGPERTSGYA